MSLVGPPVLYLLLGIAGLGLVHRVVRPISWKTGAAILALPLLFTGPALLTGRVYGPVNLPFAEKPLAPHAATHGGYHELRPRLSDLPHQIVPWRKAVRYAVKQGEWPLWNPFVLAGDPLAPTGQAA
ncbi:MAG: hypothetical protein R3234_14030, partial [Thermoanaerobaculia bacterium]|nr:hypothetical protein [Thermoanaerobaculia bacterium]